MSKHKKSPRKFKEVLKAQARKSAPLEQPVQEVAFPDQVLSTRKPSIKKPSYKKIVMACFTVLAVSITSGLLLKNSSQKQVLGISNNQVVKESSQTAKPNEETLLYPEVSAQSALVASSKKEKFLFAKNIDLALPPASTTKIITALLTIREYDLSEVVYVPDFCTKVEGSKMGLVAGEGINIESLLYGLLVSSAGDAACTLANTKFSSAEFVTKMNRLVQDIGISHTNFTNPIGFDATDGTHVSSARDLYLMTKAAMKNGIFRKIVGTKEVNLYSSNKAYVHRIVSTNRLLFDVPGSLGVKTGTTEHAKEVLVYAYEYKDDEIYIVVLGSDDRYKDTKALLDFTLANYKVF